MLKGVPKILSPELLKVLCEMGHSDRIVISDGNFPAESMGKDAIVIRCDGHGVPELLDAILQVFPLDTYVEKPVNLMEVMPGDDVETPIWDTYKDIVKKYDDRGADAIGNIERFAFYEEAKKVYAIIATGESALGQSVASYACQFVGNPYVYGGTSLTNGADCSGFVMSVYANFGVSLPHSSSGDRSVGTAVDGLANAQPGDIICYSGHVAIYIGNGQIVHASTAKTGIKISDVNYRTPLGVRRIF